jgi:hypothetical protein
MLKCRIARAPQARLSALQFPNPPVRTFCPSFLSFDWSSGEGRSQKAVSTLRGLNKAQQPSEKGTAMMGALESAEGSAGHCGVCGRETQLVDLPGKPGKSCLGCSGDLATADLLIAEIDAATFAGRNTNALVAEFEEIGVRMLHRAQSAG